jgi:acetylornithine deacetylase
VNTSVPFPSTTRAILAQLIAFDTTSSRSNLDLIRWIEAYLAQHGVTSSLTFNAEGTKANVYATIGPAGVAGICLSGHTDVVPTTGQPWTADPYTLVERDGKVFGRGTADMKGFIACVLAAVPAFLAGVREVPLHLAFSYDEEVGCVGVRGLLAALAKEPVKPLAVIIGEPTLMHVARGHKGKQAYRVVVEGRAGHSALTHLGVNAIEYACDLISFLRNKANTLRDEGPHDEAYEPAYSTIQTGKVSGGIAVNVIPERCEFDFEIRHLPSDDVVAMIDEVSAFARETVEPQMRAVDPACGVHFQRISAYPGLLGRGAHGLQRFCCGLTGFQDMITLSFGTEGGLFEAMDIPAIVCGPGSIEQAHRPDEFIELDQLARCDAFMQDLLTAVAKPGFKLD